MKFQNFVVPVALLSNILLWGESSKSQIVNIEVWAPIIMDGSTVTFIPTIIKDIQSEPGIGIIKAYARDSSNTIPTLKDYVIAKVMYVTSKNIVQVNDAIDDMHEYEVDTTNKIQMIVDKVNRKIAEDKILAYANNTMQSKPTFNDYQLAGITCVKETKINEINHFLQQSTKIENLYNVQNVVNRVENIIPMVLDNDAFDPDWVIMLSATLGLEANCETSLKGVLLTGRDMNKRQGMLYSSILHYYGRKELSIGLNVKQTMRSYYLDATSELVEHVDYNGSFSDISQFPSDSCTDYDECWGRLESTWMMCYILEHTEEKVTWVIGGHLHNVSNLLKETNVCNGKELISQKVKQIVISSGWEDRTSGDPEMNLSEGTNHKNSASDASIYLFNNRPSNVPIVIASIPKSGLLTSRVGDIYRRAEFQNSPMSFIMSVPRYGVYGDHGLSDTEALLYAIRGNKTSDGSIYKQKIKTCFHINNNGAVTIGEDCHKEDYYLEKTTSDYVEIMDFEVYNLINRVAK